MAGVLLPFLKWFIGGSGSKSPKILNFLVRSPWTTVDVIGQVRINLVWISCFYFYALLISLVHLVTFWLDHLLQVKQPILFLSGMQDEMIPPSQMQMLYAKAAVHNRRCVFEEFSNGMHMNTWLEGGDNYWRKIQHFLREHVPEKKEDESSHSDSGNASVINIPKCIFMSWLQQKISLKNENEK